MDVDLLVIGGGINGLGIAAEAARRGISVIVVEKGDIGGATTAASSRLIHGGLRYLQYGELSLVRESLRDRGRLVRERPHLVRPIRLMIPSYRGQKPPPWVLRTGLSLYDALARDPLFRPSAALDTEAVIERESAIDPEGLLGGFLYSDGQIEFPERLCVELRGEIIRCGGEVGTYTQVTQLVTRDDLVVSVWTLDKLSGEEAEIRPGKVINAGGPWVDVVNSLLPQPPPRLIGGTWGTHLILPLRDGGPAHAIYTPARRDGRPLFMLQWDGRLLLGTTDVPFEGDPDRLKSQPWETDYLLGEVNALFPEACYSPEDIQHQTVGIRPLPFTKGKRRAGAITRRHALIHHGLRGGCKNLFSVVGGKLSTFHSLAEQVISTVLPTTGAPAKTDGVSASRLADWDVELRRRAARAGVGEDVVSRLVRLYGAAAPDILARIEASLELGEPLTPGCPAITAEVHHAMENEGARTVDDVLLRRLAFLPPPEEAREKVEALLRGR